MVKVINEQNFIKSKKFISNLYYYYSLVIFTSYSARESLEIGWGFAVKSKLSFTGQVKPLGMTNSLQKLVS